MVQNLQGLISHTGAGGTGDCGRAWDGSGHAESLVSHLARLQQRKRQMESRLSLQYLNRLGEERVAHAKQQTEKPAAL